jgi:hypothetical protein
LAQTQKEAEILPPDDPTTRPQFASRINIACKKSVEAIFEVGRLLIEAKEKLSPTEYAEMVETDLPFKKGTADRFIHFAKDTRLTSHVEMLPPHWGTLEVLTKLSDVGFNGMIEDKKLNPGLERSEAAKILREDREAQVPVAVRLAKANLAEAKKAAAEEMTKKLVVTYTLTRIEAEVGELPDSDFSAFVTWFEGERQRRMPTDAPAH